MGVWVSILTMNLWCGVLTYLTCSSYRNFMMACANLIECHPTYISLLDDAITPGVRDLQKWIEKAWKDGQYCYLFELYGFFMLWH